MIPFIECQADNRSTEVPKRTDSLMQVQQFQGPGSELVCLPESTKLVAAIPIQGLDHSKTAAALAKRASRTNRDQLNYKIHRRCGTSPRSRFSGTG